MRGCGAGGGAAAAGSARTFSLSRTWAMIDISKQKRPKAKGGAVRRERVRWFGRRQHEQVRQAARPELAGLNYAWAAEQVWPAASGGVSVWGWSSGSGQIPTENRPTISRGIFGVVLIWERFARSRWLRGIAAFGWATGVLTMMIERLKALDRPIRTGLVGVGKMGEGVFYQLWRHTPNIECNVIADLNVDKVVAFLESLGCPFRVVESASAAEDAAAEGEVAVCADGMIIAEMQSVDVFIEASSAIEAAARHSLRAIENGKHLVLMNSEIDMVYGPAFMEAARRQGKVFTSCDGDQYTCIKRIIDDLELWGVEVVQAGNMKGFLDRRSDPTKVKGPADERKLDYKMCAAMADGTKMNIEMALLGNALNMRTDKPGMDGPRCKRVEDVMGLFDWDHLRTQAKPALDYVIGAEPGGGVYVVGYVDHPYQRDMLKYYKMGDGPYYLFYRPYHLCHLEVARCIGEAVLDGWPLFQPTYGFQTNVIAYAKKPLTAGEELDGLGGYATYGLIENVGEGEEEGLPACLAHHVKLNRDIAVDERIRMADVDIEAGRFDFDLYERAKHAAGGVNA